MEVVEEVQTEAEGLSGDFDRKDEEDTPREPHDTRFCLVQGVGEMLRDRDCATMRKLVSVASDLSVLSTFAMRRGSAGEIPQPPAWPSLLPALGAAARPLH